MKNSSGTIISLVVLLVIGMGFVGHAIIKNPKVSLNNEVYCIQETTENISLVAETAYAVNLKTGAVLYEKDANTQMPLASLTKLMTTLIASEVLESSSLITIRSEALTPEGNSGLLEDELWRAGDLIDFTLITSSNDGAHALALAVKEKDEKVNGRNNFDFIRAMNARAKQLNLTQTYFLNDTGLDISEYVAGAYGSARDVARLLAYAYSEAPNAFYASATPSDVFRSVSGIEHVAKHTSSLTGLLPGEAIAKTGFTDLAGGNLGIVAELVPGVPVAIVVLNSTQEARDTDVAALYKFSRERVKHATLCPK